MKTITIPKKFTASKEDFIILPRSEYERMVLLSRQVFVEEKNTDAAIRVFQSELKQKKLKSTSSFSHILK